MKNAKLLFFDTPLYGRIEATNGRFKPAGMSREMMIADTGPVGYSEKPAAGEIEFSLPNNGTYDEVDIASWVDIDITVVDDNGKVRLCKGCFVTEPPELKDGEIPVKMQFVTQVSVS